MFRTIERHEESGLGLPYPVIVMNAAQELVEDNEVIGVRVPDLEGLARSVAVTRALCPLALAGAEIRFMRRVLNMTQKQFAEALEIGTPETVSRWEHSAKGMGGYTEKLIRALVVMALAPDVPGVRVAPDAVLRLHIEQRAPDQWPEIVAERVRVRHDGSTTMEWELPQAA